MTTLAPHQFAPPEDHDDILTALCTVDGCGQILTATQHYGAAPVLARAIWPELADHSRLIRDVAVARRDDLLTLALSRPDNHLRCLDCSKTLPPTEPQPGLFPADADAAGEPPAARREASAWFGAGLSWGVAGIERIIAAVDGETDPDKLTMRELRGTRG